MRSTAPLATGTSASRVWTRRAQPVLARRPRAPTPARWFAAADTTRVRFDFVLSYKAFLWMMLLQGLAYLLAKFTLRRC